MLYRPIASLVLLLLLLPAAEARARVGDDVPAWLRQAAAVTLPAYDKDVPGVVLHDDSAVTVNDDGRVTTVNTYAVRILTRDGRGLAEAVEHYGTDTGGKVREMRAWLILADGTVKKYGKDEIVDAATSLDDVYNESRRKSLSAARDADAGAVFGYQTVTENRPFFPQMVWWFQGYLPVVSSRLTLTVPSNWRASGVTFNAAPVEPSVSGTTYTWEMRNLARVESEPASPSVRTLAAHIAVGYGPSASSGSPAARGFESWADVSRWYAELADAQAAPDDAIAEKARALTANAKTELEKVQAIGRYVQSIQYISIQIGIGGYRPHAAREVFAKQYGDCKDKATLMRAMLKAVGVESFYVLIYSGDRTRVREAWASPTQFNHCIIAVRVGAETRAPSVIEHATLGRLLIFDATDESTPVGDLPDHEQGSLALVAAGPQGALVRMPVMPPDANRLERTAEVTLGADGSITATVRDRAVGQAAVQIRRSFNNRSRPDFLKSIEQWVASGKAAGAKLSKVDPKDEHAEGRFNVDMEFTVDRYAQTMQNRLIVFKPAVVARRGTPRLVEPTRKHPIVLEPEAFTETIKFKLPEGFDVDEVPDAVKLDSEFGTYTATYEVKDGQLVFTRTLVQRASTVPAERYADVRGFFGRVRASEDAPVVLARK